MDTYSHPWVIFEGCNYVQQILEEVIKFRWGALPEDQREGIKNYISNLIIKLSTEEGVFRREKVFINKLNIILVQVWLCPPKRRRAAC